MAQSKLHISQLNLLGQLEAATLEVKIHLEAGRPLRDWWITGYDPDESVVLMWSDRTTANREGDLNLSDLMTSLLEVLRLARGTSEED